MLPTEMVGVQRQIERAVAKAEANGFRLVVGSRIEILAEKEPYVKGVRLVTLPSFESVLAYLQGYEQSKFEQQELNRVKTHDIK